MGLEMVLTGLACLALIGGFTLAGMSVMKRSGFPGATGTLGSVLSMIDPATGAPTRAESAAAREELKQRRHESTHSGKGLDHNEAYTGKITIRPAGPAGEVPQMRAVRPDFRLQRLLKRGLQRTSRPRTLSETEFPRCNRAG
jgi:hypothetical protein